MFTNPIDKVDPDKKTATYDADIKSSIKVTAAIQRGNQRDPSERNKGKEYNICSNIALRTWSEYFFLSKDLDLKTKIASKCNWANKFLSFYML